MFDTHQHYEELCALAATGQMPENEVADFRAHLADCPECSALLADFARTGAYLAAGHAAGQRNHEVPDGMTERFIARARTQGIAMGPEIAGRKAKSPSPVRTWAVTAGAVAALVLVALVVRVKAPAPQDSARNTAAHASDAARDAASQLPSSSSPDEPAALRAQEEALVARLKANLDSMAASQREKEALQARVTALEREKEGLTTNDGEHIAAISRLRAEIDKLNSEKAANDSERVATISRLQAEIDKLKSEKTSNDVAILAEENELRVLRQTVAEKEATLEQQRRLLALGNQFRDLAVARHLQMFDVYDADGEGNEQPAFGRIFYIEGKSLVFYAFDLNSPRTINKQFSFYAWGERLGGGQPVKKLGIFRNEDVNDGRWILTFDDPRVLAQINYVFVTREPDKKPVTRPTGKERLFSFLGNKANHP